MSARVTVVTGGGRGIGAATALRLARDGHDLVLGYRSDAAAAETTAAAVREVGVRCVTVPVDVTVEADVERLFAAAAERLGPVTGLVNNAGLTAHIGPLADTPVAAIRSVLDVNLLGAILCARQAARVLTAGGAIVNVSSAAATLGSAGEYVHYAAAKAGVDTLTVGLSLELAGAGVRVNAVAPGVVRTTIHADAGDPGRPDRLGPVIPLGRVAEPVDVADAVAWLLGPESSYVTGAVLRVAGGR